MNVVARGPHCASKGFHMKKVFPALAALIAGLLVLTGCETSQTALNAQCPSKWVAAGNNGAKADRYYQPHCDGD